VGTVSGNIFLGGQQCTTDFQRKTGYVQQDDLHLPTATVREALDFSAQLRQSTERTLSEKLAYVEYIIDVLDMGSYADAVIGVPGDGMYRHEIKWQS
jgi:ATP-binding cassette subfamily G (WHITE) protein 2 (PDR)